MRILAIDYGDAHTGAAVSDLTGLLAGYTEVIHSRKEEAVLQRLGELIAEYEVEELVLGYPKNMDGTLGLRAEKAESFSHVLEERFSLPVRLWDERRTTIDAHNILASAGKRAKARKKTVDAVAAALILEGYLTFRRSTSGPA
ncbi:MAG: Holliday junction resolvase RuvX [Oscillospiraceae bacterium]|nr:Holliday junction resolvase RuvX [Oscillospiraceae bacterium]